MRPAHVTLLRALHASCQAGRAAAAGPRCDEMYLCLYHSPRNCCFLMLHNLIQIF